jgi:hypothetical protein
LMVGQLALHKSRAGCLTASPLGVVRARDLLVHI